MEAFRKNHLTGKDERLMVKVSFNFATGFYDTQAGTHYARL